MRVKLNKTKENLLTSLVLKVRRFNEKHRNMAKATTFFALGLIVIVSALFTGIISLCSAVADLKPTTRRVLGVVLAAILVFVTWYTVSHRVTPESVETQVTEAGEAAAVILDTISIDSLTEEAPEDAQEDVTEDAQEETSENVQKDATGDVQEDVTEDVQEEASEDVQEDLQEDLQEDAQEDASAALAPGTPEAQLQAFMQDHPDVVGWLYFEDGHISYPIVQCEDNEKYRILDYSGEESDTGSIFLDFRSASDFSDSNSIIYGHNMKNHTMFGSLRDYREDPSYYNDHQYFQVITPDKTYRYQIFEYMDVPENYVLYDYVSDAAYEFVKDAEPVRIKSYMDSEIIVNAKSKVVTLSTCTRKDDLQFVVLGVMVEETEN